jgi:MoaA/NifB/PqqE/SkfB family radical SAM enzyme
MSKSFYFNINYKCNSNCLFCASRDLTTGAPKKDMSLDQFKATLQKNGIKSGDRVIINGGEPTIHNKFFSFLKIIKEFEAYPILFTNGVKLFDLGFVKELINFQPINIRIPFFGASDNYHDTLTGKSGNFKNTLKGFSNIIKYIEQGALVQLEAKLLLSKATYKTNINIVELLINRFSNCFYFSLNPLIFSDKVLKNKELFLETFTVMKEDTEKVIVYISEHGFFVSLNQLPFCVFNNFSPRFFSFNEYTNVKKMFFDTMTMEYGNKSPLGEDLDSDICKNCLYYKKCNGFYPEYLKEFGYDEVFAFIAKTRY